MAMQMTATYRPLARNNAGEVLNYPTIVLREVDEGSDKAIAICANTARQLAEETHSARLRNELIAAAERYVLDTMAGAS